MIAISMAIAYWIIQERLQVPLSYGTTRIEFTLTAFLLPICMMATFIFPERRIFSKFGAGYLCILLFMFFWCWIITVHFADNDMTEIWQTYLLNIPEISPLPVIVVLYSIVMCGLSAIFVLTRSNNTDLASYTCLLYSSLTFSLFSVDYISSTMFSIAGLLLLTKYNGTSSNVVTNGLLLRADIHTLWDLGLVALTMDYKVIIAQSLKNTVYAELEGHRINLPKNTALWPSQDCLSHHRQIYDI